MLRGARAARARREPPGARDFENAGAPGEHALRFVEYEDAFDGAEAKADARRVKLECLVDVSACALERGDAQKAARARRRAHASTRARRTPTLRRAVASFRRVGRRHGAVADAERRRRSRDGDARVAAERARVLAMRDEAFAATERDGKNGARTRSRRKSSRGRRCGAANKQPSLCFTRGAGRRARSTRPCRRAPPPPRARSPPRRRRASARRTASSA